MMNHQEALELLPAYMDQELGIADAIRVERHLGSCTECQREYAEQSKVSARLKKDAGYFDAPAHLATRIKLALPRAQSRAVPSKGWHFNWFNVGAAMATLLALAWSVGLYLTLPSAQERLTEELISSHVRSLQFD